MIKRINSRKRMIGWLKERILNELLSIIFNPSHFLVEFIFLGGIILTMKKFVIQWTRGWTIRVGPETSWRSPINLMDLGPSDHQLHTCSNRDLSDVGRLRCNRAFDDSPGDMCLREGAPIKISHVGPLHELRFHRSRTIGRL